MTNRAEKKYIWTIGDTTVRNPHRMKDALAALAESPLNGNVPDNKGKNDLGKLLQSKGIINYKGIAVGADVSGNIGKWCMALSRLGFITPKLTRGKLTGAIDPNLAPFTKSVRDLTGRPYEVTPNGRRLIDSDDCISKENECILRALVCYRTLSPFSLNDSRSFEEKFTDSFFPLKFILDIIHELERLDAKPNITSDEYALLIQTTFLPDQACDVASRIIRYREMRVKYKGKINCLNRRISDCIARKAGKDKDITFEDLYDRTNCAFLHLRASGLFYESDGRGIELFESQKLLANLIRDQYVSYSSFGDFFNAHVCGAHLPVDDIGNAIDIVTDLKKQLSIWGIKAPSLKLDKNTDIEFLHDTRHSLQKQLMEAEERDYAKKQVRNVDEILKYLEIIPKGGNKSVEHNGKELKVPRDERPVYLEWAVWRAFLAIGDIGDAPWNTRKFRVNREFMPLRHAPPGGPDMVFEFEDVVVVVEVTLTDSSRQEAAEGEPVRRHVAKYVKESGKNVYGLFIAPNIDNNTAHTFIEGNWYFSDTDRKNLEIVPVTISDFRIFLEIVVGKQQNASRKLIHLLSECRRMSNAERHAPAWKRSISLRFTQLGESQTSSRVEFDPGDERSHQLSPLDTDGQSV